MKRPSASQSWLLGVLLAAAIAACSEEPAPQAAPPPASAPAPAAVSSPPPEPVCCLEVGEVGEGDLAPGARARFAFDLAAGDGLEVVARQDGADVALLVADPAGQVVLRLDRPVGRSEPEHLVFVAEETGGHLVEIESLGKSGPGRFRLEVVALGPATAETRRRAAAIESLAEGHELRRAGAVGEAVARFHEAAGQWRVLGDRSREADALDWEAWCLAQEGRREEATEVLGRAIRGFGASGETRRQAVSLVDLANTLHGLGRTEEALTRHREVLDLRRRLGDRPGEAMALTQIANLHKVRSELSAAELRYKEALALWEQLDRPRDQAITLANLAGAYSVAGQPQLALDLLGQAGALLASSGTPQDRAFVLEERGIAHRRLAQPEQAMNVYREALALRREAEVPNGAAIAFEGLGRLHYEAGEYDRALALYREALALVEPERDRLRTATLVQSMGWIRLHQAKPREALGLFQGALPVFQEVQFAAGEAATLAGIARVERALGHLEAASDWAERSLDVLEELRADSDRLDLRASLLATKQRYFDFAVDTLMELERRAPEGGFAEIAFAVSERARARRLLDSLPGSWRQGNVAASAAQASFDSLRRRVNSAEERRLRLLAGGTSGEELAGAERDLRAALEALRGSVDRITGDGSSGAEPLPLGRIQGSLLGPDTLLLSYDLGEERSYLWAVTEERLETFVLPSGQDLEREARNTHFLLSHSHERASGLQAEIQVAKLERLLLGPVADQIREYPRLLVSVEGDLHLIPFGALPDPGSDGALLLARHEIAYAPSASVLVWLGERPERAGSQASRRTLAVVADPVFGPDDDRLRRTRGADLATGAGRTPPVLAGPHLRRLPYSEREADAVLALVPANDRSSARSFAARKELLTEGGLSDYRILHFATHGWFSPEHPELSALVLSRLDEAGRPRDGVVWAHEIAALDLRADLVVLSACETGLGAPIHGEGLVGLSDAFFRAGVPRVLVSLWRVDDQAAVELMTGFYQGFLHQGLTASEALGRAQLAVRADPRWQRPYYWAGFVLQGQW